jgi:hypothetical protein
MVALLTFFLPTIFSSQGFNDGSQDTLYRSRLPSEKDELQPSCAPGLLPIGDELRALWKKHFAAISRNWRPANWW